MPEDNYLKTELSNLLKANDKTWEFLQAGSLDGVWYWDLENPENEWMSPELWRLFGVDPTTKTHNPAEWQDLIFEEDLVVALEAFHAHCEDPTHPYDQVVRYRHANGSTVWVRCRGLAIRDETGKAIRMLGAHTDMTSAKRSEENARAAQLAAEAANEELRSFAYSISHDMKAPVNTLHLLLSELALSAEKDMNADAQNLMDLSKETVTRMKSLVEDLLDYTHIIGMDPNFEQVPLANSATDAMLNLLAEINDSGAQISVGTLPEISGVRTQLTMLFQNLISNAIKFCKDGTAPQISIYSDPNNYPDTANTPQHKIIVQDNGIGISKENHAKIFQIFQRLHTRESYAGTGLGLTLCTRIAAIHEGHITVDSHLHEGCKFIITLPGHTT